MAPALATQIVRDSLAIFLSRSTSLQKSANILPEESSHQWNKHSRLSAVLLASLTFGDEVDQLVRENAVVETVVLAHHHLMSSFAIFSISPFFSLMGFTLGGSDRQTWIDVCQKATVDPRAVVDKHLDRLLKLVLDASAAKSQVPFISSSIYSLNDDESGWFRGREL